MMMTSVELEHVLRSIWEATRLLGRVAPMLAPRNDAQANEMKVVAKQVTESQRLLGASIESLETLLAEKYAPEQDPATPSPEEIDGLLRLNMLLTATTELLHCVASEQMPRLEAKCADPADPLWDYEMDARIDFRLRSDDPSFDDDEENNLASRTVSIKHLVELRRRNRERADWARSDLPAALRAQPHCWLFYDLVEHEYGDGGARLSYRDCLSVGEVFVDVAVRHQYLFAVEAGVA